MALKTWFGGLAVALIAEQGREIQDVAAKIPKTPPNQFSKWKNGKWTYIAEKKLLTLIDQIAGRDRDKRVRMMIAYLVDMTPDSFRPLIKIEPLVGEEEQAPPVGMRLSPGVAEKLEAIGKAYNRDEDFMKMADSLAKFATAINKRADK